ITTFRHRKSPSSDRFLRKLTLSSPSSSDFELTEADLFFTNGGFSESSTSPNNSNKKSNNNKLGFRMQENSGILAALPGDCGNRATTPFRAIPKPQRVPSDSTQFKKFQHSAPVNVPSMMKKPKKFGQLSEFPDERENDDEEDEEEMLPPHEIVAMKLKSTSSVLEGVGRTLKGRDLRQVRNAVWRQTGFLD
ncbi:hypothetical protein RDABS01_025232, partial [Bienertia sinuspersici]